MTKPPNFVSAEVGVDVCVEMPSAQPNKLHLRSCCCIQFNCDLYNLKAALVECALIAQQKAWLQNPEGY